MKATTVARAPYTKQSIWVKRVREAANGCESDRSWCLAHNIKPSSFQVWRVKLRRQGILPTLYDWADGFEKNAHCCSVLWQPDENRPAVRVHFVTQPLERVSFDHCYWVVRCILKQNPDSGELFLFQRRDQQVLYTLCKTSGAFCFRKSILDRRLSHWPSKVTERGTADITRVQLKQLLNLAGL